MKEPWSMSTTVRNPERLPGFLSVLYELDGMPWDSDTQTKYQIMLIQKRVYGKNAQFFQDLNLEQVKLLTGTDDISFQEAKEIFEAKKYKSPPMRGRQSFNPLKKMGCVDVVDGVIKLSSLGHYFLEDDSDLGDVFFKFFLKLQFPNPASEKNFRIEDGFNIKPFIGALHLIHLVNKKWAFLDRKPKGISKNEFNLFVPTLINYQGIEKQADKIIALRLLCEEGESMEVFEKCSICFAEEFLGSKSGVENLLKNLKDYGDNTLRYFRLTRFFYIRGGGFYVDLEPRRKIEIDTLLKQDNAMPIDFSTKGEYQKYMSNINLPVLPWETDSLLNKIIKKSTMELKKLENKLPASIASSLKVEYKKFENMKHKELIDYAEELRAVRRNIQEALLQVEYQDVKKIKICIDELSNIKRSKKKKPIELEHLTVLSLNALNDAYKISPNYPVGDDNQPTFTAPAGKADIECFYEDFNAVCEVTMLENRSQWYNEGQPVMRHVRDFEEKYKGKDVYCLFVAPRLHQDTIETFWMSVKYGYRGKNQKIIPLKISQLVNILEALVACHADKNKITHQDLQNLYNKILTLTDHVAHSGEWIEKISMVVKNWTEEITCEN